MEKLEIEDDAARLNRIQSTLEKLNASSTSVTTPPRFDFTAQRSTPHFIPPPSELLSRVQAFLPTLEASNSLLAQRCQADPRSVDIEHVDDGMEEYIEMNLGLGVFEDRSHRTHSHAHSQDAEMSCSSSSSSSMSSASSSSSSSSTSNSDSSENTDSDSDAEIITSFKPVRPIKPLPKRRARPQIVVLGQTQTQSGESED
ncbi:hypothetical protein Hypma_012253 [Hypsizygus marmoreus]|uniref:Uncharacterized protein n=1 Tax=Hypsizygus marmoreus TaxID=39966 RepID=A0A369JPC3_HYPMA|nr:hypothetical protein Hypma_012253 [Hypsizygus marmoreus]